MSDRWGPGTVQRYDPGQVTVLFDEHGYRELYLPAVLERNLLRPALRRAHLLHLAAAGLGYRRALVFPPSQGG